MTRSIHLRAFQFIMFLSAAFLILSFIASDTANNLSIAYSVSVLAASIIGSRDL